MGSALFQFVQRMDSPTPDTFRIFLGEANGFMLEALGKPSSNVPFIMPKRIAETDATSRSRSTSARAPTSSSATSSSPATRRCT
jgi:peptide/nickel transport system substrate-binding protein